MTIRSSTPNDSAQTHKPRTTRPRDGRTEGPPPRFGGRRSRTSQTTNYNGTTTANTTTAASTSEVVNVNETGWRENGRCAVIFRKLCFGT